MADIFLQSPILVNFVYPFLLVFFIVFAVLERTKILGEEKKQINALVAFVVGLLFVGIVSSQELIQNMILYLSIALVIMFVVYLLWGFLFVNEDFKINSSLRNTLMVIIGLGVVITVFYTTGIGGKLFGAFFNADWSSTFWTNFFFILLIGAALAIALKSGGSGKSS
jgi:hypothetical protein